MSPVRATRRLMVHDWRDLPAERMAALYQVERERWSSVLRWDTARNWEEVERGRQLGTVSGLIVTAPGGAIAGWSYFLVHNGSLQIGGFNAVSENATQVLLDGILRAQPLEEVGDAVLFAYPEPPGAEASLQAMGFTFDRYHYLAREVAPVASVARPEMRSWLLKDLQGTADLFARAYGTGDGARPFAPAGTSEQWCEYVLQLACGDGCGSLIPGASLCIPSGQDRLLGVVLVTRLARDTAHLAQLAVHPELQGQRRGTQLLDAACAAAAAAGHRLMTLLVGSGNSRARELYRSAGFTTRGTFVAARTRQPRRSTSVAAGSAAMTRR